MDANLTQEFDELQARLASLRKTIEAKEQQDAQEATERRERRQAALDAAQANRQEEHWTLDRVGEPSWDEEQRVWIVRWRTIDRATARHFERSFDGLGNAIKHFQSLMKQKTKEQRDQSHKDASEAGW